jgi:hypothetical protein
MASTTPGHFPPNYTQIPTFSWKCSLSFLCFISLLTLHYLRTSLCLKQEDILVIRKTSPERYDEPLKDLYTLEVDWPLCTLLSIFVKREGPKLSYWVVKDNPSQSPRSIRHCWKSFNFSSDSFYLDILFCIFSLFSRLFNYARTGLTQYCF